MTGKSNYEIIIRNETNTKSSSPIAGSDAESKDTSGNESDNPKLAAAKALGIVNGYIKPFADQLITNYQSTISLRTGAQEHEERISVTTQIGRKVWNFGSSIAVGALIGGVGGALLTGAISAATMAIDLAHRQTQLDIQRSTENTSLRYMNLRAGGSVASFSGSRKTQ